MVGARSWKGITRAVRMGLESMVGFSDCRIVLLQTYGRFGVQKNRINLKFTSLYAHTVG